MLLYRLGRLYLHGFAWLDAHHTETSHRVFIGPAVRSELTVADEFIY
jgi:hypothetical protein